MIDPIGDLRHLRNERSDWLLTVLTGVVTLLIICVRPSPGSWYYRLSSICYRPVARDHRRHGDHFQQPHGPRFDVDCPCCQYCRVFPANLLPGTLPSPHLGWRMVDLRRHSGDRGHSRPFSARGRVTYHRIVGAVLLYLLIAVAFATLYLFVGLLDHDAIKGITFNDDHSVASELFYLSFVTLTSTGYGDIIPVHPLARSLCNMESVIGQVYPATLLARIVTLELRGPGQ